ncbi:DUF2141 domain-containing protein [Flaviflagellibacter deserti]|uniref:DUF2141 domain-containing protein n=1 Tax=Flaviflagellibacter deserti TaxID=2267266 RepID=A0ABV9Z4M9_9HYPH
MPRIKSDQRTLMSRSGIAGLGALAFASVLSVSSAQAADVLLLIDGIEPTKGIVRVAFCNTGPLDECRQFSAEQPASAETLGFRFQNVPPGRYAFVGYQDMDESGKNERNMLGMPKEPFALSNGAGSKLIPPPDHEDLAMDVLDGPEETTIEITLQTVTATKKKKGLGKAPIETVPVVLVGDVMNPPPEGTPLPAPVLGGLPPASTPTTAKPATAKAPAAPKAAAAPKPTAVMPAPAPK